MRARLFDDKSDAGELALLETEKIKRVVQDMYDSLGELSECVKAFESRIQAFDVRMAGIAGMLQAKGVHVNIGEVAGNANIASEGGSVNG